MASSSSSCYVEEEELQFKRASDYLLQGTYPPGATKNEKRVIRKKASKLCLRGDGEIFCKKKGGREVRYIVDITERKRILRMCHCHPTSGHFGICRTIERISERFTWPGITNDVKLLVASCDACQRTGRKIEVAAPKLNPVPVVAPWHHIGIDFIGPISPPSHQGNAYILTLCDYFTKYVIALPMPTKHASGVASALFKVFMKMGLCRVVTSDQGTEFNNELNKELMQLLDIDYRLTTPYHPQANGLIERFNQTIQYMLVKYIEKRKEDWEDYLDECQFAYNTARHESTKFTPFELMFNRKAILPIDLQTVKSEANDALKDCLPLLSEADTKMDIDARLDILQQAKKNIILAQARQKEAYDKRHSCSDDTFKIGSIVLKKDFTRKKRKGGKLDSWWVGPYKIIQSLGRGLYKLQDVSDATKVIARVNGVHLKKYIMPERASGSDDHDDFESFDSEFLSSIKKPRYDTLSPLPSSIDSIPNELSLTTVDGPLTPLPPLLDALEDMSFEPSPLSLTASSSDLEVLPQTAHSIELTESNLEEVQIEHITSSSPKPTKKFYADFFPLHLAELPSPISDQHSLPHGLGLNASDCRQLFDGEWLTDKHVNATNKLLRQQFPCIDGLQCPLMLSIPGKPYESSCKKFVQIINISNIHWVCASNVLSSPGVIEIYDSKPEFSIKSAYLHKQVAKMLKTDDKSFQLNHVEVQRQKGSKDCALFAIANAVTLCFGGDPHITSYNQHLIRSHLAKCFENERMSSFPSAEQPRRLGRKRVIHHKRIDVFCVCRLPWDKFDNDFGPLVKCQLCQEWYHEVCMDINKEVIDYPTLKYNCKLCLNID